MIAVFIEIQRQGKFLPPMRLCSGKMWKSNVKKKKFHIISHVGLSELSHTNHVVLKLLRNHLRLCQQNGPELEILQRQYVWLLLFYHYGSYEKKKNLS